MCKKKKSKIEDFPVNYKSMWLGQVKEQSYSHYLKKGEKSYSEAQNMTKNNNVPQNFSSSHCKSLFSKGIFLIDLRKNFTHEDK